MYIVYNTKNLKSRKEKNLGVLGSEIEDFIKKTKIFKNRKILREVLGLEKHKSKLDQFFAKKENTVLKLKNYIIHRV